MLLKLTVVEIMEPMKLQFQLTEDAGRILVLFLNQVTKSKQYKLNRVKEMKDYQVKDAVVGKRELGIDGADDESYGVQVQVQVPKAVVDDILEYSLRRAADLQWRIQSIESDDPKARADCELSLVHVQQRKGFNRDPDRIEILYCTSTESVTDL